MHCYYFKFHKFNFRSKGQGARGKRLPPSLKVYLLAFILISIVFNYSLAPCPLLLAPRVFPSVGTFESQGGNNSVPPWEQNLFQSLFEQFHLIVEVIEAVNLQVIANATAVGRDDLVVGDAVEAEQLLQTSEVGIGNADSFLVGKPLADIVLIGIATTWYALASNEDELDVITLGNLLA